MRFPAGQVRFETWRAGVYLLLGPSPGHGMQRCLVLQEREGWKPPGEEPGRVVHLTERWLGDRTEALEDGGDRW